MSISGIPYSGSYANYLSTISILSLQLMISTQFTDKECQNWEKNLKQNLGENKVRIITNPILNRLREAPLFLLNELRLSSISSAILSFTSTTEHYLKDMIELSLKRNIGLRKKAFSQINIPAIELEEIDSLNEIKKKLFKSIAAEHSKGELFSKKIYKSSSFLNVKTKRNKELDTSLDSIWILRNKIAHSNKGLLDKFEIIIGNNKMVITNNPSKSEYLNFSVGFLGIVEEFNSFLKNWDYIVLEKWPATSFIH